LASALDLEGAGPLDELEEQVAHVRGLGCETTLLVDPSQAELELTLLNGAFDTVFSPIARCYRTADNGEVVPRDYAIFGVLERIGQAFIGSPFFRSMEVDDKTLASGRHGLAPPGVLVSRALFERHPEAVATMLSQVRYPQLIKPNSLGGSLGIDRDSIVHDEASALRRIGKMFDRFSPVTYVRAEEFIDGAREFTVTVLGNGSAVATSVTEVVKPNPSGDLFGEDDKNVHVSQRRIRYAIVDDPILRGAAATLAHDVFRHFQLRDWARFDMLYKDRFFVVDINVPPILSNSLSYEWQVLYGVKKSELLAIVLSAFHYRCLTERGASNIPPGLLATVPLQIRSALSPLGPTGRGL
jgi:D-alanine-D-alanine ligase-like ATP-grasp enzyme